MICQNDYDLKEFWPMLVLQTAACCNTSLFNLTVAIEKLPDPAQQHGSKIKTLSASNCVMLSCLENPRLLALRHIEKVHLHWRRISFGRTLVRLLAIVKLDVLAGCSVS